MENNHIYVDDKKISSDQAAYMALNKNLIEPLLGWKFVTESKVGSHHIISLTEDGIHTLKSIISVWKVNSKPCRYLDAPNF